MIESFPVSDRAAWLALRERDITASVAGALLGLHEYTTPFALWALKTGRLSEDPEETPPMRRGRLLEPVAIEMLREERPDWIVEPGRTYFRDPSIRLGATPDTRVVCPRRGLGTVQIKSVEQSVFRRKWQVDPYGPVEPPLWIAVQAIVEAHLTGAAWASVAPLVVGHGVELPIIEIPLIPGVIDRVREATVAFWTMIEEGREPDPDYAHDAETIDELFLVDEGGEIDLSHDNRIPELLAERAAAKADEKDAKARTEAANAEIKHKLAGAAIGHLGDGRRITWKTQHRKGFEVHPTSFRVLRVPSGD